MDWRQKVIAERYNGNAARFEADFADDVEVGRMHAVNWNDLLVDATALIHLKGDARGLIEHYLGYLPADSTILRFEPYLRALIQIHHQNLLTEQHYRHQLEEHIKLIRKADLRYNTCQTYAEAVFRDYHETFVPYGQPVFNSLTKFLGYEPQLEHSLIAEIWLRDVIARDTIQLPDEITPIDWKVLTLIKYREVLLERGQAAADASPFLRSHQV